MVSMHVTGMKSNKALRGVLSYLRYPCCWHGLLLTSYAATDASILNGTMSARSRIDSRLPTVATTTRRGGGWLASCLLELSIVDVA